MSGVIFLICGIISIYVFNFSKMAIIKFIVVFPVVSYISVFMLAEYSIGAIRAKASGILILIDSGFTLDESTLNIITSDRWTAILYSLIQFLRKPLFGHGIYLEDINGMLGNVNKYTTASGGHNFFIDLSAYMGVCCVPLILLYTKFIKLASEATRKSLNSNSYKLNIAIFSVLISVFVSNILNSWLLFSSFDNFIFMLAGYVIGQLFLNRNQIVIDKKA